MWLNSIIYLIVYCLLVTYFQHTFLEDVSKVFCESEAPIVLVREMPTFLYAPLIGQDVTKPKTWISGVMQYHHLPKNVLACRRRNFFALYIGCIISILWMQSANCFYYESCRWRSVHHFHQLTFVGITWASTMFLRRSKNMAVFNLEVTRIFDPETAMYILIMEYYSNTKSRADPSINHGAYLWHLGRVRIIIILQQSIG